MNKTGLLLLGGSIGAAAVLAFVWLLGFVAHIGGALIHLLLVLALLIGFIGSIIGMVAIVVGKKT
ncbi:MAG TPA: hypothetical protein VLL54_15585 [Pyrinomonadaceae bacterium]|nr:hypothetical protein [Pyrinomonadaceae bacterium]